MGVGKVGGGSERVRGHRHRQGASREDEPTLVLCECGRRSAAAA